VKKVLNRPFDINISSRVLGFDCNNRVFGTLVCPAFSTLTPAPSSGSNSLTLIAKDNLSQLRFLGMAAAKGYKQFSSISIVDRQRRRQSACVEDSDGQSVPDAHKVSDINQKINLRNVTFLGQAPHQGFSGTSIFGGISPEFPERPSPGIDCWNLAKWLIFVS
jgi:hypothetical protein